jgi:hypothetical protein
MTYSSLSISTSTSDYPVEVPPVQLCELCQISIDLWLARSKYYGEHSSTHHDTAAFLQTSADAGCGFCEQLIQTIKPKAALEEPNETGKGLIDFGPRRDYGDDVYPFRWTSAANDIFGVVYVERAYKIRMFDIKYT